MDYLLEELGKPESLITYVADRKGHDQRYAIDPGKAERELGWKPKTKFYELVSMMTKADLELMQNKKNSGSFVQPW